MAAHSKSVSSYRMIRGPALDACITFRPMPSTGELTLKRDGQTSTLRQGEAATIEPNVWHDWWNASDRDARVRVEVTPGERFGHMIETLFGLARLGHTDSQGMANLLQLALVAREFSDVMVFRSPPLVVQRALFGVLAPIARWRGYRATYPQLSRTVLAARTQASSLQFKMCNGSDLALLGLGQLCGTVTAII